MAFIKASRRLDVLYVIFRVSLDTENMIFEESKALCLLRLAFLAAISTLQPVPVFSTCLPRCKHLVAPLTLTRKDGVLIDLERA